MKNISLKLLIIIIGLMCVVIISVWGCKDPCKDADIEPIGTLCFYLYYASTHNDFFLNVTDTANYNIDSMDILDQNNKKAYWYYCLETVNNFSRYFFTIDFINESEHQVVFESIITKYYYLKFNQNDIDTLKLIFKGEYVGECNREYYNTLKIYYNDSLYFDKHNVDVAFEHFSKEEN